MNARLIVERFRGDERGAGYLAAFIVLFATLTLAGVGVLVDSARIVSAERHASAAAYEAARAGAQAVQLSSAREGGASLAGDDARAAAAAAVDGLLAGSDARLSGVTVTDVEVIVTVSRQVDPWFPVLSGRTISETGRARLLIGITQEGQ